MFNSTQYMSKMITHLENNVTDSFDVVVKEKFPNQFLSYPLVDTNLIVFCKEINFTTVSSNPSGTLALAISIYTARDRGSFAHQDILDSVMKALCSFTHYAIAEINIGESKFDRTNSAINTTVICTVNFGTQA